MCQGCTILIISLSYSVGVPSYNSSWNRGGHNAPKFKRAEPEVSQANGAAEPSSTELIRKSSQAELGAGFYEGDGLIDSHPKLEDS